MVQVQIADKQFQSYISRAQIAARVSELAQQMEMSLSTSNPLFLCVLNGSFVFAADLLRCFTFPCEISFVKLASYSGLGTTGEVKQLIGLNEDLRGRTVVVIEDIVDTGITMGNIIQQLQSLGAAQVAVVTCFYKPTAFRGNYTIDFTAFEIDDLFVIGYGMDYNGYGRNLPDLYQLVRDEV